jgi:uncharacterized membrane protein
MVELIAIGGFVAAIAALFWGLMWTVDRKAKTELELERHAYELDRLRASIEADARARERFARGELLQDDGHKRN